MPLPVRVREKDTMLVPMGNCAASPVRGGGLVLQPYQAVVLEFEAGMRRSLRLTPHFCRFCDVPSHFHVAWSS